MSPTLQADALTSEPPGKWRKDKVKCPLYNEIVLEIGRNWLMFSEISSVAQLCLPLQPHELQNARLPCSSPTPRVCSNSCPSSQWCHTTISNFLPSIFPSIRIFSKKSVLCTRWPNYWSFCFSISPSNEYSGMISFRMDSLDLLAVQGTLKSLLQHHSSKASILWNSAFIMVQLPHPYMTNGKTIALTRWAFVGKIIRVRVSHLICWFYI